MSPVIEGIAIKTNTNAAYHLRKQREQGERLEDDYELMGSLSGGPPTDGHNMTYTPSPYSSSPATRPPVAPPPVAPPTASNVGVSEEVEGVYESIPCDQ